MFVIIVIPGSLSPANADENYFDDDSPDPGGKTAKTKAQNLELFNSVLGLQVLFSPTSYGLLFHNVCSRDCGLLKVKNAHRQTQTYTQQCIPKP
jgi:hypothetical protein